MCELRINETKFYTENDSNCNYLHFVVNNKRKCDARVMFRDSIQNFDLYFNETNPDTENASNCNYFNVGVNKKSKCHQTAMF